MVLQESGEQERLNTLAKYEILDTEPEDCFDDLTTLAAAVFNVPISLVTLVDDHRQWFKSHHGIEAEQTPRDNGFCARTIQSDALLVVPDTHADDRFREHPLVVSDPHIRFYAGAPLIVADGSRLGSLCVIDRVPRVPDEDRMKYLKILRNAVVAQLELRRLKNLSLERGQFITTCAWCEKVRPTGSGKSDHSWLSPAYVLQQQNMVSHGICPDCRERMLAETDSQV